MKKLYKPIIILLLSVIVLPSYSLAQNSTSNSKSLLASIYCATLGAWLNSPSCRDDVNTILPAYPPSSETTAGTVNQYFNSTTTPPSLGATAGEAIQSTSRTTPIYSDSNITSLINSAVQNALSRYTTTNTNSFNPNDFVTRDFLSRQIGAIGDSTGRTVSSVSSNITNSGTLTSPTITAPTISGGTLSSPTFTGISTFNGNVGIGTSTPWAELSVNPNGITGPAFVIGSSTATKFIVTNGGNVGIGTTNPIHPLQIGTQANSLGPPSPNDSFTVLNDNYGFFSLSGKNANSDVGFALNQGSGNGGSGNTFSVMGIIGTQSDDNYGLGTGTSGDIVWQTYYGSVFRPIITVPVSTNNAIFGGNVGIGTTSPYARLSVEGSSVLGNSALAGYFTATSTTATSTFAGGLNVAGSSGLSVLQNGRVGIGLSNPNTALSIGSSGTLLGDGTASTSVNGLNIVVPTSGTTYGLSVSNPRNGSQGGNGILVQAGTLTGATYVIRAQNGEATPTDVFFVKSNGSAGFPATTAFGIGLSNPSSALSIGANSTALMGDGSATTSSTGINLRIGSVAGYAMGIENPRSGSGHAYGLLVKAGVSVYEDYVIRAMDGEATSGDVFWTKSNGKAYLKGNVGIATTTPWRTLSVVGTVAVNGLTANSGSNYAVCINNTTKELTADVGGACNPSSERFKNNIQPLSVSATDIINSLKPSSFAYNDTNTTRYGLIAEQVSLIDPHLATYEEDGITPHGLDTSAILSVLVKAVQELTTKLNNYISQGIASMKDLVVETLTATVGKFNNVEVSNGLQMIDEVSGEKYCVKIRNGDWSKIQGSCVVVPTISSTPTPTPTPVPTETNTSTMNSSTNNSNIQTSSTTSSIISTPSESPISTSTQAATSTEMIPATTTTESVGIETSSPSASPEPTSSVQPPFVAEENITEITSTVTEAPPIVETTNQATSESVTTDTTSEASSDVSPATETAPTI